MEAQIKARQQAQALQDALQDLHTWEESIKAKDEALKRKKTGPVTPAHAATHTYDNYRDKWDAFDVDAALASSDDDHPAPPQPLLAPIHTRTLPRPEPATALDWKERGNTQFRNRQYAAALESYTRSIDMQPTCIAYANRAMARLKLNQYGEAEQDASAALELDASYIKAWQRRAAARSALGRALEAAGDLERAVLLAPDNRYAHCHRVMQGRRACVPRVLPCGAGLAVSAASSGALWLSTKLQWGPWKAAGPCHPPPPCTWRSLWSREQHLVQIHLHRYPLHQQQPLHQQPPSECQRQCPPRQWQWSKGPWAPTPPPRVHRVLLRGRGWSLKRNGGRSEATRLGRPRC